jgi:DNA polymerase-3 subunit epsilon
LLAEVYIEMNGGRQAALGLSVSAGTESHQSSSSGGSGWLAARPEPLPARLSAEERRAHALLVESLGEEAIWSRHYSKGS